MVVVADHRCQHCPVLHYLLSHPFINRLLRPGHGQHKYWMCRGRGYAAEYGGDGGGGVRGRGVGVSLLL
jgi:hypothetical protein